MEEWVSSARFNITDCMGAGEEFEPQAWEFSPAPLPDTPKLLLSFQNSTLSSFKQITCDASSRMPFDSIQLQETLSMMLPGTRDASGTIY